MKPGDRVSVSALTTAIVHVVKDGFALIRCEQPRPEPHKPWLVARVEHLTKA